MKLLLIDKGLFDTVSGSSDDQAKGDKSLVPIGLPVQDAQIVHVQHFASWKEAWNALSTLYDSNGVANKLFPMEAPMNAKMSGSHKVEQHIEKPRRPVTRLGMLVISIDNYQ